MRVGAPRRRLYRHFEPLGVDDLARADGFSPTDDCRAAYEELKSRGVDFVETPEERPYGIDSAFHDPSGNVFRLTQLREPARV
jgi:hypothetical protein